MELVESKGSWAILFAMGGMYENMGTVLDHLERGDAKTAKVLEGTDHKGSVCTFVVIQNYQK